jgi:sortase A
MSQTAVRAEPTVDLEPAEPVVVGGRGDRYREQPPLRQFPPLDGRLILTRTMTAVGLLVLLFVLYELFATSIMEARSQSALLASFRERLSHPATLQPAALGDGVAILEIPRLQSQVVVVEGVRPVDLQHGPGHDPGSPLPGQVGNAVMEGHRTTYGAPFRDIASLERGDTIGVFTTQGRFTYTILEVRQTTNVPTIATTDQVGYLTLITSDPPYFPTHQVQVLAQLVTQPLAPPGDVQLAVGAVRNGSGVDERAFGPVLLWGELLAAALVLAWVLYRRWSPWATHLITSPIIVALMFLLFSSIDRLLPRLL